MEMALQDHYKTLGIRSSADDAVIEAAYRALVRIYHPDTYQGDKGYANKRLQEINEAWSVLSNPARKKQHNDNCGETSSEPRDNGYSSGATDPDWDFVLSYYPDLRRTSAELREVSVELEANFQNTLLLHRQFSNRAGLAKKLEEKYLQEKFGVNANVQSLARAALKQKQRGFAKKLNEAIKRLGEDEIDTILRRLAADYPEFSKRYYVIHNFGHLLAEPKKGPKQMNLRRKSTYNPTPSQDSLNSYFPFLLIMLVFIVLIVLADIPQVACLLTSRSPDCAG